MSQQLESPAVPVGPTVRCECRRCGVHVVATAGFSLGGCCANCGSYDIAPIEEKAAPAPDPVPADSLGRRRGAGNRARTARPRGARHSVIAPVASAH